MIVSLLNLGVIVAVTLWWRAERENTRAVREHTEQLKTLNSTLDDVKGRIVKVERTK